MRLNKDLATVRNGLSVLIAILGMTWLWVTKLQHPLKDYIEPLLVVIGSLIALYQFLMLRWGNDEVSQIKEPDYFNIANTTGNKTLLHQAKEAIKNAQLSDALQFLSQINSPALNEEVAVLSARLARQRQENIQGVLTYDENDRILNKISRDALALVVGLEQELATRANYQQTIKAYLLKRYMDRLSQKMANRQPINLRLLPTTEGTSNEMSASFFAPISGKSLKGYITGIFEAAQGRLLITGVPGSGKTTILLELAVGLLEKEMSNLPILLNLATWKKEYITLETWLKEILPTEMGVSKLLAVNLLQQDQIILLFDGFDEIKDEDRESCLEAIGRYGSVAHRKFVITSRIAEYKAVTNDAPVYQQIEIGAFTLSQMEDELERLWRDQKQPEAKTLLLAIQQDSNLRKAIEDPFYFNTLQLLLANGKHILDLNLKDKSIASTKECLIHKFVEYQLESIHLQNHSPEQTKRYLSFLAFNMSKWNIDVFELVNLQYSWYKGKYSNWEIFLANFIFNLVVGPLGSLIVILFSGLTTSLVVLIMSRFAISYIVYIMVGFITGLGVSFMVSITRDWHERLSDIHIVTKDNLKKKYTNVTKNKLVKGIWAGLLLGFIIIIYTYFFPNLDSSLYPISIGGLVVCFIGGLVISLYVSYDSCNSNKIIVQGIALDNIISQYNTGHNAAVTQINRPYHRFKESARLLYFSIIQHYHLLYLLNKRELLPSYIVPFLNTLKKHYILEREGAGWRFRNRILQEYFAKNYSDISSK